MEPDKILDSRQPPLEYKVRRRINLTDWIYLKLEPGLQMTKERMI